MTSMAEVRDALGVLKTEEKRANALRGAIDTVEKYIQSQPALTQLEEKIARAQQELGRLQDSVKTDTKRLEAVNAEKASVVAATKKEISDLKAAANNDINAAKQRAEQAKADTAKIVAECQKEIHAKRKELEEISRDRDALRSKLA